MVGLLPDIKAKIVGSEGDFNQLLLKARFEEVKLRELGAIQSSPTISVTQNTPNIPRSTFISRQQMSSGARPNVSPRCYNCGSTFHLIRQCPHLVKNKNTETPGKKGNESRDSNHVSNITLAKKSPQSNYNEDGESRDDISSELDEIIATMHGITPDNVTGRVQLGPTLTAMKEVEGEVIEALLDTGSPVTIIQLETLLQILAKKRCSGETPAEWRATVESRLEPSAVVLQNYSGDKLRVVRQIKVTLSCSGHSARAIIQVQKSAPAKLLVGTDLLSKLGYYFVQALEESNNCNTLDASVHKLDNRERKADATVSELAQQNVYVLGAGINNSDDKQDKVDTAVLGVVKHNVESVEVEAPSSVLGTVSSIQAVKIPARHQKLGRDPRSPTTLDMDNNAKQEIDVDTYKGEMAIKFNEVWDLAQNNIKRAQRHQKAYYDKQSKPPRFKVGDRVFVYMPAAKATKAYKFARSLHGPYRIIEQSDTGLVVRPIDKPQGEPIRVAYNGIRHYCDSLPNKFWPTRAKSNKRPATGSSSEDEGVTKQRVNIQDINNPWKHRLRPRRTGGDT